MAIEANQVICPKCGGSGESKSADDDFICTGCDGDGYIEFVRHKPSKVQEKE